MTAPTLNRTQANPHPALAPALKHAHALIPADAIPGRGSLWPLGLLILGALSAAAVAEATAEAWPLAMLLAVPLLALAWDRLASLSPKAPPRPARAARLVCDRRPTLLRPVIKIPPCRPGKILRRLPIADAPGPAPLRRARRSTLVHRRRPS